MDAPITEDINEGKTDSFWYGVGWAPPEVKFLQEQILCVIHQEHLNWTNFCIVKMNTILLCDEIVQNNVIIIIITWWGCTNFPLEAQTYTRCLPSVYIRIVCSEYYHNMYVYLIENQPKS